MVQLNCDGSFGSKQMIPEAFLDFALTHSAWSMPMNFCGQRRLTHSQDLASVGAEMSCCRPSGRRSSSLELQQQRWVRKSHRIEYEPECFFTEIRKPDLVCLPENMTAGLVWDLVKEEQNL